MQKQLSKALILLIIFSVSIVGFFSFMVLENYYLKSVKADLQSDALLVRDIIEPYLVDGNRQSLQNKVEFITSQINKNITVIQNGIIIADSQDPMRRGSKETVISSSLNQSFDFPTFRDIWERQMFFIEVPVKSPGVPFIIRISTPLVQVKETILKISTVIVIAAILSAIAALFLSIRFSSRIVAPIREMIRVTKEFSKGNFTRLIHTGFNDELGQLGDALNFMAARLEKSVQELDDRTTKMEAILSGMVDGVIAVDNTGRILLVNPMAEKIFNISARNASGRHLIEVIRNYELNEFINTCLKQGITSVKELILLPGEQILRVHVSPFRDYSGKTFGIVAVIRDITELRRLEKIRSDFVANVSHELRTPLTSIKGFVETLLDGAYKDPHLAKRFLNIIDFETGRLCRLINDLLDLSQLETNQIKLNMEIVKLPGIIEEIMMIFEARLREKDLSFSTQFPENLPGVKADPDWLRQVFINLVDNAVKYTPNNGKIWIEAEEKNNNFIEIRVCDTGIGIPKQDIPRLFERFYRVDKARSRQIGGTGLGLSIVKHIIKSLGGEIRVESKVGEGSKFILLLQKAV
ncbi:MAG TPA: cell wall metabolism sensor histidine kinase WalK [Thermoanaerobacterales bacterium]|nr:cell wall metabolism sensor histidine kinase WalK [Thermoanaerobacterales bacterium]